MKMRQVVVVLALVGVGIFLIPVQTIQRQRPFKISRKEKYLGKWYEIARLDFKFERD
jgi:apolipoprotein D and lipocalin family protein